MGSLFGKENEGMDTLIKGLSRVNEVGTDAVIVRAYGDEPVKLIAVSREAGAVLVTGIGGGKSIGFPSRDVYHFAADVYAALLDAYDSGDRQALLSRWQEAVRYA
jgi:hypothetical protein